MIDNWILAVAGSKRALVLHPDEEQCLQVDRDTSRETWRQSPMPALHAREWLAQHCPPDKFVQPLALQHVFEDGDMLHIPSGWVHYVETGPRSEGAWWASLNRFMDPESRAEEEHGLPAEAPPAGQSTAGQSTAVDDQPLRPSHADGRQQP